MNAHIIKVTLEHCSPPVWRRIAIPENLSFYDLHLIIQIAFGWEEMHLHEFELSNSRQYIVEDSTPEQSGLAESQTLLDSYLLTENYIRYTYDFGDNWSHKIVYEKDDPNYPYHYPQIQKAKGDNFAEDCGGVFSHTNNRISFDIDEANMRLQTESKYFLSLTHSTDTITPADRKPLTTLNNTLNSESDTITLNQLASSFLSLLKKRQKTTKTKLNKKLDKLEEFMSDYELDVSLAKTNGKPCSYALQKKTSNNTTFDFFSQIDGKHLSDYIHYLQLGTAPHRLTDRARMVSDFLLASPEYYLYILDSDILSFMRRLLNMPDGEITEPLSYLGLSCMVSLGLADVNFCNQKSQTIATLHIASDAASIIAQLTDEVCTRTYNYLETNLAQLKSYLNVYGFIELDRLYDMYSTQLNTSMPKEEFYRFCYWHLRMCNYVVTFSNATQTISYIGITNLDYHSIMHEREQYSELNYYPLTPKELNVFSKDINIIYPEWNSLLELHQECCDYSDDELWDIFQQLYTDTLNGFTPSDFMELQIGECNFCSLATVWPYFVNVCLHTKLPSLKGYSRAEYAKLKNCSPLEVLMPDTSDKTDTIKDTTEPWNMPIVIQEKLLNILKLEKPLLILRELELLLRETHSNNDYIKYYIIHHAMLSNKMTKASRCCNELLLKYPDNPELQDYATVLNHTSTHAVTSYDIGSTFNLDDMYDFQSGDITQMPFTRTEKKIGRNDPCPCGSGKKYKKCCGK